MAASATFALKAGVWFRRARLLIVSPDSRVNLARRQAETPLIPLFRFLRPALAGLKGCVAQLGAGLAFNVQTRQWQDAFFNADKAFVLRLQYLGDKQSWTGVQR